MIAHVFSHSQSPIATIKSRINRGTSVAHIATEYYLVGVMARDGEIDLSFLLTATMLADCFTKPLPKPGFLKRCAAMGILRNGLGNGLWNGLRNDLRIGIGKGIGIAVGKKIHWARLF